jgi:hypothetical protein
MKNKLEAYKHLKSEIQLDLKDFFGNITEDNVDEKWLFFKTIPKELLYGFDGHIIFVSYGMFNCTIVPSTLYMQRYETESTTDIYYRFEADNEHQLEILFYLKKYFMENLYGRFTYDW